MGMPWNIHTCGLQQHWHADCQRMSGSIVLACQQARPLKDWHLGTRKEGGGVRW